MLEEYSKISPIKANHFLIWEDIKMSIIHFLPLLPLTLLEGDDLLNAHSGLDGDADLILAAVPSVTDLLGHGLGVRGEVDVGLLVATFVHEGDLPVFPDVHNVPLGAVDDGDGGAVGGRDHVLELLAGEDVGGGEVALGVPVLPGLGYGDAQDLAGLALDHDEAVRCRCRQGSEAKMERGARTRNRLRLMIHLSRDNIKRDSGTKIEPN